MGRNYRKKKTFLLKKSIESVHTFYPEDRILLYVDKDFLQQIKKHGTKLADFIEVVSIDFEHPRKWYYGFPKVFVGSLQNEPFCQLDTDVLLDKEHSFPSKSFLETNNALRFVGIGLQKDAKFARKYYKHILTRILRVDAPPFFVGGELMYFRDIEIAKEIYNQVRYVLNTPGKFYYHGIDELCTALTVKDCFSDCLFLDLSEILHISFNRNKWYNSNLYNILL